MSAMVSEINIHYTIHDKTYTYLQYLPCKIAFNYRINYWHSISNMACQNRRNILISSFRQMLFFLQYEFCKPEKRHSMHFPTIYKWFDRIWICISGGGMAITRAMDLLQSQIARFMGPTWPHESHGWPHESCYLGYHPSKVHSMAPYHAT